MPRPFAICALVLVAVLSGCAGLADEVPDPTYGTPTALPGPWTAWARDLGFDPGSDTGAPADPAMLQQALDGLDDADLEDWNAELRAGDEVTMRLASWLWPSASAQQVTRLHELMPRLEPRVTVAAGWRLADPDPAALPSLDDVHQGGADDCWLIAGLGAVAEVAPEVLAERATRNANGTWTIRWDVDGEVVPVTVSPYLPADDSGDLLYAHDSAWSTPNWSSMFEKAHAALPRFGSYARLAGGAMVADTPVTVAAAMAAVLGAPSETAPAREVTLTQVRTALEQNRPVAVTTFLTGLAPAPGDGEVRLIDRHVYMVQAVEDDRLVLRNPWGISSAAGPETVRVTAEQLQRRFLLVTFGAIAGR